MSNCVKLNIMKRILHFFAVMLSIMAVSLQFGCYDGAEPETRAEQIITEIHNPNSKNVLVICHRGDWRNYPENSIPAIESVIGMGADMVEIDVQLTKDSGWC